MLRTNTSYRSTVLMLLTNEYRPDPRVAAEIDVLLERGFDVRLVCWDRDGQLSCAAGRHEDGAHAARTGRGSLSIERVIVHSTHGRGVSQARFLMKFWFKAMWQARRGVFDVVHAHDLDAMPLGWALARIANVPLVFDAHESYSDMMQGHLPPFACGLLRRLESCMLGAADAVVTVGERLAQHLRDHGAGRVVIVPNAKSPHEFRVSESDRISWRAEQGLRDDQWCLGYISHLGPERPVPALLAAAARCPEMLLIVGGSGHFEPQVRHAAATHANIRFIGEVPPADVPRLTACFDAVFCGFDPNNPNARFSAPNKLYEALAAGRPLLTGSYGEIGAVVRMHQCGIAVDQFTEAALVAAMEQLAEPARRNAMGRIAAELGAAQFNWEHVRMRLPELHRSLQRPTAVQWVPRSA